MIRHYALTLTGAAQRLSSVLSPDDQANRRAFRELALQALGSNSNPIYVGGSSSVSATDYGFRINVPTGGVPDSPERLGAYDTGPLRLEDLWVIGTGSEVLHVLGVEF